MGSVIEYGSKCMRCGKESIHEEYNYKTDEVIRFCRFCGEEFKRFLKRNNERELVRKESVYELQEVYLVTYKNDSSGTILFKIPLSEIESVNTEVVLDCINGRRYISENGSNFLCKKTENEFEKILFIGDILEVSGNKLIIKELMYEETYVKGHGVIRTGYKNGLVKYMALSKLCSRVEAEQFIEQEKTNPETENVDCSWFNPETETFEILCGFKDVVSDKCEYSDKIPDTTEETNRVKTYLDKMINAVGTKLLEPDGIYSGREGHERFARECGYALNDFNEREQKELLSASYSTLYVRGCNLKPILDAAEWISIMHSQLKSK